MAKAEDDIRRLAQKEFLEWIKRDIQPMQMLEVFLRKKDVSEDIAVYCGLIDNAHIKRALSKDAWDLGEDEGRPGAVEWQERGRKKVQYLRFGNDDGIEPLVFCRHFSGLKPPYLEISEEFRHFHDLYHANDSNRFLKIDDAGNDHEIVVVETDHVRIRFQEIRQFCAVKAMHLAVFFDCRAFSDLSLEDLCLQKAVYKYRQGLLSYSFCYSEQPHHKHAFSRLLGKRFFAPLPKSRSGFWGFAAQERHKVVAFVVGASANGREKVLRADPDNLRTYLTPVFFRREVLEKYYGQPSKYSVEDGYLRCCALWGARIDNLSDDYITVWLGDLGRDMPYEEQLHWRSFNILPTGGVSEKAFRRQILNQWNCSDIPEHRFRRLYDALVSASIKSLGWPLFLPLNDQDSHNLDSMRVPANDEQKDFDELVLALAKVLIDSLNEKQLVQLLSPNERKVSGKGITRLEKVLEARKACGYEIHMNFLRNLQELRSAGTAHCKGSKYMIAARKLGVGSQNLPTSFREILLKAIDFLEFLHNLVQQDVLLSDTAFGNK